MRKKKRPIWKYSTKHMKKQLVESGRNSVARKIVFEILKKRSGCFSYTEYL